MFLEEKEKAELGKRKRDSDDEGDEPNKERKLDEVEDGEVASDSEPSSESSSESSSDSSSSLEEGEDDEVPDKSSSIFMAKSIKPYYGRIFLMRSDIPYIDLQK